MGEQRQLGAEVVVHALLVHAGELRDALDRRAIGATLGELGGRGRHDLALSAFGIPCHANDSTTPTLGLQSIDETSKVFQRHRWTDVDGHCPPAPLRSWMHHWPSGARAISTSRRRARWRGSLWVHPSPPAPFAGRR